MKKIECLNTKWCQVYDIVLKVNKLVETVNEIIDKMEVIE